MKLQKIRLKYTIMLLLLAAILPAQSLRLKSLDSLVVAADRPGAGSLTRSPAQRMLGLTLSVILAATGARLAAALLQPTCWLVVVAPARKPPLV